MASSDFDTLTSARNGKWENNVPGKVIPLPQKVSSKTVSGKMDTYPQKDNHAERNNSDHNKVKPSHKIHRENSIPVTNAGLPHDLSSNFVNAMFNIPPNFADPSSAVLSTTAYLNAFGLPHFPPLPLQFNPGNIAVASVMPNALETLAAQLGSMAHPHIPPSPHSPCTSPSDFNPANVFSNSLRPRIPSILSDYDQQLSNYIRFYSNSLNPLAASQNNATFPKPSSTRKHPAPKSDKARKEHSIETSRCSGVSMHDKRNYMQNGDDTKRHMPSQSPVKHKLDILQQNDSTRKTAFNKLPTLPSKDQKSRNEVGKTVESFTKAHSNKTEKSNSNKKSKNLHASIKPKDFGAEEAAAILLHLSSAAENECAIEAPGQDKRVVAQQPIDYSSRSVAHHESAKCKRWSNTNLSFHTINKSDNDHRKLVVDKPNSTNKQLINSSVSPNSELVYSDNDYAFELHSDGSKIQPGGFNFKKVICKKFTSERDPNDKSEVADAENISEQNNKLSETGERVNNFNRVQYNPTGSDPIKLTKTSSHQQQQHMFNGNNISKCTKLPKPPLQGKVKPAANYSHKISSKKYIKPSKNVHNKVNDKPHYSAQSFSDLRAISKHFHSNNNTTAKSAHRTGTEGLYRDAFGGSASSLESEGAESDNEDKEDESESESEEESSSEEESEEEIEEKEVLPKASWNEDSTTTKRQFSLSRPKFTLSKAIFNSKDQEAVPAQQECTNDQSKITIRSPTFKFSKLSNESKLKNSESRDGSNGNNKSGNGLKHRVKIMPRVSAITLPKPRLAARVSKNVDKKGKIATLPELKLEEGSKSKLKSLFMQALNRSGESGGKPVGIPVDHKSLKAIGLGTTSYFLHNNKKYILRRALAKKKVVTAKQTSKESTEDDFEVRKKSKYVIQQVPSTKIISRLETSPSTNDNEVNNARALNRDDANSDQSKASNKSSSATKRRKRSLDAIPTITCDDDCDIFSIVKLRRRASLHNSTKDISATSSSIKQNNTTVTTNAVIHHSRKRQWQKHAKRPLKSSTDMFLLSQTYNKSVARAKKICLRRNNENYHKNVLNIRQSDFNKKPSHSVRIMASGATRPSYQILRQIRETKDGNNNPIVANDESQKLADKMDTEPTKISDSKSTSENTTNNTTVSEISVPPSGNESSAIHDEANGDLDQGECHDSSKTDGISSYNDEIIDEGDDDVIADIKQTSSSYDAGKTSKSKRKFSVSNAVKTKPNSSDSFKLLSLFTSPPTLSLDAAFCDIQPSYNMWIAASDVHRPSVHKQSLLNWKYGENAVEIKQQQQRDGWKNMTLNTFPNA